ncbi:MAG: hypothetical protein FJY29_03045 [Betaproteobacteria bacterium]|nr:hypothetical protein [Betaproteobacteria bacterium]
MLKRSHFTVDLWFIFGSFCYGAEAFPVACRRDGVLLRLKAPSPAAQAEMLTFFEQIGDKAKALVRTEVRLFVSSNPEETAAENWAEELVTTLLTDNKPRVNATDHELDIELLDVRGLTPTDQSTWVNLVTDIWPQLPA